MVRILGEDPEASDDAAMSPTRRWTVPSQTLGARSPSTAPSRSLNKVSSAAVGAEAAIATALPR